MADDEVIDDEMEVEEDDDLIDDVIDDELDGDDLEDDEDDVPDEELVASVVDDVEDAEEEAPPVPAKGRAGDEEDDDDDDVDPDDVEEDLDTILKDRIAAGADEDDEDDEEAPIEEGPGGDRVAPRAAEEFSCNECFLLVRRSQFSAKRTDCPGGLDGEDCPVKRELGLA